MPPIITLHTKFTITLAIKHLVNVTYVLCRHKEYAKHASIDWNVYPIKNIPSGFIIYPMTSLNRPITRAGYGPNNIQAVAKNKNPNPIPNSPKPDGIGINLHTITAASNNDIITKDLISLNALNEPLKNDI